MKKSQRVILLEALRDNGTSGVNSYDATYNMSIKQAPTRIYELKQLGHDIVSKPQKDGSTTWILTNYVPERKYVWDINDQGLGYKKYL